MIKVIKQEFKFRLQRKIHVLIGAKIKNANDQKPIPIRNAHVSVTVNVICKANIANAQMN